MILVDTSVWANHINREVRTLVSLLESGQVLVHPFVIGELAMGNLRQRELVLHNLRRLPQAVVASDQETLSLIEHRRLFGRGIGYIDAHLLAAAQLSAGAMLWTFDKNLDAAAAQLGLAYRPSV